MDNKLLEECQEVLENHGLIETEIFTNDNRCFLRRISPFRRADKGTDGIVVSYVDLTAIKRAEAEQRERDACFREIFEHAATGIAIGNLQGFFE